jgi:hypothetical protein
MFEPPPGCVQIPLECFAKPDRMGLPGPLGYDIFGPHEGWCAEKVENYAKGCGTPLCDRRYHDDGSLFVLPLAQVLVADMSKHNAADAAKGSKNWGVSAGLEAHNLHKCPLASAGTFIKGLGC